ncbi:MAG: glutathione S-transferase family protein [Mariprofundales bacterium]
MGLLIDGVWHDQWYDTKSTGGKFERKESQFRHQIGDADFPAESGRYHLYVSLACPWAHRTLIFRKLKKLDTLIGVTVVHPHMLQNGWQFDGAEKIYGFEYAHQLYTLADKEYSGRVTIPLLWDKKTKTIVSNESAEIIRMFNYEFNHLTANTDDYYPKSLRQDIDVINKYVYNGINNGVYRCGFATTQLAYDEAFDALFAALDEIDGRLQGQRYLLGKALTEADWRLFTTLVRFDAVYYSHFKCNRQRISDYPSLYGYLRDLYQHQDIAETINMKHIKQHYYYSHKGINPTQIVPKGPLLDFAAPHERASLAR